jgi:hypothetical protein
VGLGRKLVRQYEGLHALLGVRTLGREHLGEKARYRPCAF